MGEVPGGPDKYHPTRIYGANYDTKASPPPVLWGTNRASSVISIGGSNIEIRYLEITDHHYCAYNSPTVGCRLYPMTSPYADTGISAKSKTTRSDSVMIKDVKIHGLGHSGMHIGNISNWILDNVYLRANGFAGIDGDIQFSGKSWTGTNILKNVTIEYSGCSEAYPPTGTDNDIRYCFGQELGGYGDGVGLADFTGDVLVENSNISHNVQDGLDLLYHDGQGAVTISRSIFMGNAGNPIKVAPRVLNIYNTLAIGNCDYFSGNPMADPGWRDGDSCRAFGNTLTWSIKSPGGAASITNSVLFGHGDVLIDVGGRGCDGSERVVSRNNIFVGGVEYHDNTDKASLYYNGTPCAGITFDNRDSVVFNVKQTNLCPNSNNVLCADPRFTAPPYLGVNGSGANAPYSDYLWDFMPRPDSPALKQTSLLPGTIIPGAQPAGAVVVPLVDYRNYVRGSGYIVWGAFDPSGTLPTRVPSAPTGVFVTQDQLK